MIWRNRLSASSPPIRRKLNASPPVGDEQIAAEYRQLTQEALARAERYQSLANLAEE
jgi:hypothetical protein